MSLNGTCLKWLTIINLFNIKNHMLNISKFMKVPLLAVPQHSGIERFSMQHFVLVLELVLNNIQFLPNLQLSFMDMPCTTNVLNDYPFEKRFFT
jgi:hypothetical protein